ncbi:hypothetical protein SBV1_390021 [Verrucomicrobia bacterium]|nr:hypothetical protein SBV1_390021 [Verrucomicrobiota bacterium]
MDKIIRDRNAGRGSFLTANLILADNREWGRGGGNWQKTFSPRRAQGEGKNRWSSSLGINQLPVCEKGERVSERSSGCATKRTLPLERRIE